MRRTDDPAALACFTRAPAGGNTPCTASTNPIRFGVNIRRPTFPEILDLARVAEEAGFDTVSFSDRPRTKPGGMRRSRPRLGR